MRSLGHGPTSQIAMIKKVLGTLCIKKVMPHMKKISNPNKLMYPEDKITKEDVLNYYQEVHEYILPYIALRPLTLLRCPNDYHQCFYQRHLNETTTPKALYKTEEYLYLKDQQGLFELVQIGVLEIHPWGSTIKHLDSPDILIFDLDPAPDVAWFKVVAAAYEIKEYLAQYHLTSFVKTTGGKGLHVVIPIKPKYNWDKVQQFSQLFVQTMEQIKPDEYISKMTKAKRQGKIFIDYLRNQRSATAIAPYSTRARLHAPVATPLFWDELSKNNEDNSYTINTLPKRLQSLKQDPWENFWTVNNNLDLKN